MKITQNIVRTYVLELNNKEFQDLIEMARLNNDIYNENFLSNDELDRLSPEDIGHKYMGRVQERVSKIGNITASYIMNQATEVNNL